jgi:hypothetical protein
LDNSWIDAGLQKMGSIAVTKRMNGDSAFGDPCSVPGLTERSLDTVNGHGLVGSWGLIVSSAQSREDENGVPVGYPVAAKQLIGVLRKGNVAVLGSVATMDMDHPSLAVNVEDLQGQCFGDPQTAGIDGGKASVVVKRSDTPQKPEDLFALQDTRKPFVLFGFEVGEDVPVSLEHIDKEESDPAVGNAKSGRRPFVHISAVKKVVFEFRLADLVRSLLVIIYELAY